MNSGKKSVGPRETCLSLLILLTLVTIGGGVITVQSRFNPAVVSLTDTRKAAVSAEQNISTDPAQSLVELPPGIRPLSAPETFSPQRMSDKINGKAELYLSAGCKGLQTQRFRDRASQERWMEIFVFDMGSHENAYAVYSSQRREDAQPMELTANSYRTQNALYWIHGGYYVEFIASEATAAAIGAMEKMARSFIGAHRGETGAIAGPELFPVTGLDRSSIRMIPADAFGFDKLDRVFTAAYDRQGQELTAYFSSRSSNQAAAELATAYRDFLIQFGGVDVTAQGDPGLAEAVVIEIMGFYEIIFTRGNYLAGVHEAAGLPSAISTARELYHRLEESGIAN